MTMGKTENIGGTGYDLLYIDKESYCNKDGNKIEKEKVIKIINDFLGSFDSFSIDTYEVKSIAVNEVENDALVEFYICYRGVLEKTPHFIEFKGDGCFKLHPSEYGGWSIYHIDLPGFKF